MTRRAEILSRLQALMPSLKSRWHIRSIEVFGSVARGEDSESSDLDLIVDFEPSAQVPMFRELIEKDIIHVEN